MIGDSYAAKDRGVKELSEAQASLLLSGTKLAEAERAYRIAKATLILKLRDAGQPTTLIPDLVKVYIDVSNEI